MGHNEDDTDSHNYVPLEKRTCRSPGFLRGHGARKADKDSASCIIGFSSGADLFAAAWLIVLDVVQQRENCRKMDPSFLYCNESFQNGKMGPFLLWHSGF